MAPPWIRVQSEGAPEHGGLPGDPWEGQETVLSIDAKLSVEGRTGFLSALFPLGPLVRTTQHSESCGHLKELSEENDKKVETKLEAAWCYRRERSSLQHPLLPVASMHPSHRPPLFSAFSHALWKSGTVIKAISDVYSGDVQYKA